MRRAGHPRWGGLFRTGIEVLYSPQDRRGGDAKAQHCRQLGKRGKKSGKQGISGEKYRVPLVTKQLGPKKGSSVEKRHFSQIRGACILPITREKTPGFVRRGPDLIQWKKMASGFGKAPPEGVGFRGGPRFARRERDS